MDMALGKKEGSCCVCLWNVVTCDPGAISSVCVTSGLSQEPGAANTSLGSFVSQQSHKQSISLICIDGVITLGWGSPGDLGRRVTGHTGHKPWTPDFPALQGWGWDFGYFLC